MYADNEFLYPYFSNFSQGFQQFQELCHSQASTTSMENMIPTSSIFEYDLGGEGDLFKAPEPIIEDSSVISQLDPMTAAEVSVRSCGDDMPADHDQGLKVGDMDLLQNQQLLSEVYYECRKDMLEKTDSLVSEVLDVKFPGITMDEIQIEEEDKFIPAVQKSESSGCLSSMEWAANGGGSMRPSFLDFPDVVDLGIAYGMRRAFSEGDIKTLGGNNGKISVIHSPIQEQRPLMVGSCSSEARMHKLSRYRSKKSRRNFGRKIKYACRKALADSQPRVRGRFARSEETEICTKRKQEQLLDSYFERGN